MIDSLSLFHFNFDYKLAESSLNANIPHKKIRTREDNDTKFALGSQPWLECRRKFCILLLRKRFKWLNSECFQQVTKQELQCSTPNFLALPARNNFTFNP